jgi:hypothetical protein
VGDVAGDTELGGAKPRGIPLSRAKGAAPSGPGAGARASGTRGEYSCAGRVPDASPRGLGLLLPRPPDLGAVVLVGPDCAGLRYGLVGLARVTQAAACPGGFRVGCAPLSPCPASCWGTCPTGCRDSGRRPRDGLFTFRSSSAECPQNGRQLRSFRGFSQATRR